MFTSSKALSLKQNKDPEHKRNKMLFLAVGDKLIWPWFMWLLVSHVQCLMTQMQLIRIIKKLNVWVMWIWTLNIMRNCRTPGWHWNLTATLTGAGGFSSFHFWQVYVLNETCREASSSKQRHNQLQDLSAVPSEVTENKLMPIQKPKPLLIPHGQTAPKP